MEKNTFEKIKEEIKKLSDIEIDEIRESSRNEMDRLKKEFEEKRGRFISEKKLEFEREAQLKKRELVTGEKIGFKKKLLNKKRELIEDIYEGALKGLKNLEPAKYRIFIENLLKEVVVTKNEVLQPSEKENIFDDAFIRRINKKNSWNIKLGKKTSGIEGGFLIEAKDYETIVDWDSIKEFIRQKEEDRITADLFSKINNE